MNILYSNHQFDLPSKISTNFVAILCTAFLFLSSFMHATSNTPNPRELISSMMDHWRGTTSYTEMSMTIKRPEWQRVMTMKSWTQGEDQSLVRVTKPYKDAGNGTLMMGDNQMWTFTPKLNRIIKVPSSMMTQNWMGSDFSNKDISKTTDVIDQYNHHLKEIRQQGRHTIYVVESIPHEDAPVVWGKEVFIIRDDNVLLEQQFWDQDGGLVKSMKTIDIETIDGRPIATVMRMQKSGATGEWTEVKTHAVKFDVELAGNIFTLSNLRNPRQ